MSNKEDAIVALEQLVQDIRTGRIVLKDFCHEIDISRIDWPRMGMTSITYYVEEENGHAPDDQLQK